MTPVMGNPPYVTPSEAARKLHIERIDVVRFCLAHDVPVYQGRMSWPQLEAAWEQTR